ncbi:MAG: hypothetical protein K0R18_69 [Bacillales bacterium]|jgi:AAA15 family ATPase/GTPase|nr:hypothetical protein [Bacillales bacterium]
MRLRTPEFIDIDKKLFNKYPVKFPLKDRVSIIHGLNGTGKTKTLEVLVEYFKEQGEHVIYFPSDRVFSFDIDEVEALEVMWAMTDEQNILKKYGFHIYPWDINDMKGQYIDSGMLQLINLFGTLAFLDKPSVIIIDTLERSLHAVIRRSILKDLMAVPKIHKLIVTSYSPEVYRDFEDFTINIRECVQLGS